MKSPLVLADQPEDLALLKKSELYRKSRELFVRGGGTYFPSLVSSKRLIYEDLVIQPEVTYSPIEPERRWALSINDKEARTKELTLLRDFITNVFHEQNHRILYASLPWPFLSRDRVSYFNWIESIAISLDRCLSDEIGIVASIEGFNLGVLYERGTSMENESLVEGRRVSSERFAVSVVTTYLLLSGVPTDILPSFCSKVLSEKMGNGFKKENLNWIEGISSRSGRLSPGFVHNSNPKWQKKNKEAFGGSRRFRTLPRLKPITKKSFFLETPSDFFERSKQILDHLEVPTL